MKRSDQLFSFLNKEYKFMKTGRMLVSIFEVALGIFVGALLPLMFEKPENWQTKLFFVSAIVYVFAVFWRLTHEKLFSISALGELKSSLDLQLATTEIQRKNNSYKYIDAAILALNGQTCTLDDDSNNICDLDLKLGLESIYSPLIKKTAVVLNTDESEFSIGAHIKWVQEVPTQPNSYQASRPYTIVLKDDLQILLDLPHDLLQDTFLRDLQFDLQNQLRKTDRHLRFVSEAYQHNGKCYRIISAPIPQICESDDCDGSIFIIVENLSNLPNELENFLNILGRLFANWLLKYHQCVQKRISDEVKSHTIEKLTGTAERLKLLKKVVSDLPTEDNGSGIGENRKGWKNGNPPEVAEAISTIESDKT